MDFSVPIRIGDFKYYTPNGYIVPAKFGVHFPPLTKHVPKRTILNLRRYAANNWQISTSCLYLVE